jgi:hypothetical protein
MSKIPHLSLVFPAEGISTAVFKSLPEVAAGDGNRIIRLFSTMGIGFRREDYCYGAY